MMIQGITIKPSITPKELESKFDLNPARERHSNKRASLLRDPTHVQRTQYETGNSRKESSDCILHAAIAF